MATLEILALILLVLLNGFLAMSELAIVSSRRARLERLAADGRQGAKMALALADDPGRFLATVQVGLTTVGIGAGAFSGATLARRADQWLDVFPAIAPYSKPLGFVMVVASVTCLSLIVGELAPKQIALKNPEAIAMRVARPMFLFTRMAAPVVWLLNLMTTWLLSLLGLRPGFERRVTDEDIMGVLIEGERSGLIHAAEREMIEGVLDLTERKVSAIMTPRPAVAWIDLQEPKHEILRRIGHCPYAQLLVCRGTIDRLVGVIRKQDILDQALVGAMPLDFAKALHAHLTIPEHTSILRTLDLFRKTPVNTAVVIDEYGSVQGIVTRTDLLEAVAGRLAEVDGRAENAVTTRADGSIELNGTALITDVDKLLQLDEPSPAEVVTVAGLVLSMLDHVPSSGEQVVLGSWIFEIAEMDGTRIKKIVAKPGRAPTRNPGL
jgi:putative hemolysin